jgi:hypothetical protein
MSVSMKALPNLALCMTPARFCTRQAETLILSRINTLGKPPSLRIHHDSYNLEQRRIQKRRRTSHEQLRGTKGSWLGIHHKEFVCMSCSKYRSLTT